MEQKGVSMECALLSANRPTHFIDRNITVVQNCQHKMMTVHKCPTSLSSVAHAAECLLYTEKLMEHLFLYHSYWYHKKQCLTFRYNSHQHSSCITPGKMGSLRKII